MAQANILSKLFIIITVYYFPHLFQRIITNVHIQMQKNNFLIKDIGIYRKKNRDNDHLWEINV